MDRKEEELRSLKATVFNKDKWNLERACESGGWITLLPISQDGTDIFKEDFRDDLRW